MKSYGIIDQPKPSNEAEFHLENLKLKGFSIKERLISADFCDLLKELLLIQYNDIVKFWTEEKLTVIQEKDMVRMPFVKEKTFFALFMHPDIIELTTLVLGNHFHLHLQNGIINKPNDIHHQSSWHRDLPYQNWTISRPIAFNAFICLTDFRHDNGATFFLPYSHRFEGFPSPNFVEENKLQVTAPKGSVIFFDSMVFHQAGYNGTNEIRIGVNNMFVTPILKQQVNLTAIKYPFELTPDEKRILGFDFRVPDSVDAFRERRLEKVKNVKR